MSDYWILEGKTPKQVRDVGEWTQKFERGSRRVAETTAGSAYVSTVFLGVNHQWGDGPPLLFETMIFGGPHDQDQWRYSTWDEAEKGHAAAVEVALSPAEDGLNAKG